MRKPMITQLLANPNTIVDSATGLYAPTDAVLEMNCARSEIAAVAASSTSSNASTKSQTTSDDHSDDSREQSLGMLASMIADRVDLALDWVIRHSTKRYSHSADLRTLSAQPSSHNATQCSRE